MQHVALTLLVSQVCMGDAPFRCMHFPPTPVYPLVDSPYANIVQVVSARTSAIPRRHDELQQRAMGDTPLVRSGCTERHNMRYGCVVLHARTSGGAATHIPVPRFRRHMACNCRAVRGNSCEESASSDSICNARTLVVGLERAGARRRRRAQFHTWGANSCLWQRPSGVGHATCPRRLRRTI